MKKFSGTLSVATAVFLLAAMAACGSDSDAEPSPTPTSSATRPSTSPTPTTPETEATTAAVQGVTTYYSVVDELRQDPDASLNRLDEVAISTQLSAQKKFLTSQRNEGLRQVGDTQVIETTVQSVNLDNSDPAAGRVPTVTIDVCWDISAADLLDPNDKSVVPADRPERGWTRLIAANYSWETDPEGGWRIASGEDLEKAPCGG